MRFHLLLVPGLLLGLLACNEAPTRVDAAAVKGATENADAKISRFSSDGQQGSVDLDPLQAPDTADAQPADGDAASAENQDSEGQRPEGRRGSIDSEVQQPQLPKAGPGNVVLPDGSVQLPEGMKLPEGFKQPDLSGKLPLNDMDSLSDDAMRNAIAAGLADFSCKSGSGPVICQPVDASGRPITLPADVKVEWFASEGREASESPIKAEATKSGSAWALNMSDFQERPILVRLSRGPAQVDMYVVPE